MLLRTIICYPVRQLALSLLLGCLVAAAPAVLAQNGPDLRLLIDASAGMQQSDPLGQRMQALNLLVQLLPTGASAGIWLFADDIEVLVPHAMVSDAWRAEALATLAQPVTRDMGNLRDIPGALQAALADLDAPANGRRRSLLLLTDGRVDVAPSPMLNAGAARGILEQLVPRLNDAGVTVYTLALSARADSSFLQALAQSTGGTSAQADSPSALPGGFLDLFERAVGLSQLAQENGRFNVDALVERLFVVVAGEPASAPVLVSPAGEQLPARSLGKESGLAVIEVAAPQPGRWAVEFKGEAEIRLPVHSALGLAATLIPPQPLSAGQAASLLVRIEGLDKLPPAPAAQQEVALGLQVQGPDNSVQELDSQAIQAIGDGEYRVQLPALTNAGRYRLLLQLASDGIRRQLPLSAEVIAADGQPTLVTRSMAPERDEFRLPLILLGASLAVALVILAFVLRRRKQRKLEIWQWRAEQLRAKGNGGLAPGAGATRRDPGEALESNNTTQ